MGNKKAKELHELSDDDILQLCIITGFSKEIIMHYYEGFLIDCPNGKLSM